MSVVPQNQLKSHLTALDYYAPLKTRSLMKSTGLVLVATLFISILAQVQMPWYPVPFTLQPLAVVFVGLVFPWRLAFSTIITYIGLASLGMPVLTGFKAGLFWPSSGYIFGYVPAIVFISLLCQFWAGQNMMKRVASVFFGNVVLFASGVTVLSFFVGIETAIQTGFLPFLLSDFVIKNLLAVFLSLQAFKLIKRRS